ncbi:hypothetical protein DDR33_24095 [Pararcticibacter amylolyticus]|uniref:Uncharacterized protein n=1 Tax=Pararcticibacter amylolyticus TaxID=2173175 RepID=A0A2U2P9P6_9SPHI|nr:hypothetical protein DDR33_24095 [Pararcticibacter amylolyticus]
MIIFDYIFYRIAHFFHKKDGDEGVRALAFVVVIQGLLLISLFFFIQMISATHIDLRGWSKYVAVVLMVILGGINFIRYRGKYRYLHTRWGNNETKEQKLVRGVLVLFAIVIPYLLAICTSLLVYK